MRVVLAGASGAIGRYLVPQLIAAKHEVIGITRTPGSLAGTGAREIVADVLDRSSLLLALSGVRADAVVHQVTSLKKPPTTYKAMRETNRLRAEGTSSLLAAARQVGAKKFVAASFFGGYGFNDFGRLPLSEDAPFGEPDDRNDAVLLALLTLEQQVRAYGGMSLRYGLFYDSVATGVSPVSRTWNGVVPMVHLKDAARAAVLALAKYKAGAVYNIADDAPMTYRDREIARAEAAGLKPPLQLPDSVLRAAAPFGAMLLTRTNMKLDSTRARTELGWQPEFPSLLECLKVAPPTPAKPVVAVRPIAEVLEAPAPEELPVPEPTAVPEPGPTPPVTDDSKNRPSVPVGSEGPGPEETPEPEPEQEPEPEPADEAPKPDEPKKPRDPFADIDAAIARIGASQRD